MEPCPNKPGVIFDINEAPIVIEALRAYVGNQGIVHTPHAQEVLDELNNTYSPKYGYSGGVFVPEDEALAISWVLKGVEESMSSTIVSLGAFGILFAIKPPAVSYRQQMAKQIRQTAKTSRNIC